MRRRRTIARRRLPENVDAEYGVRPRRQFDQRSTCFDRDALIRKAKENNDAVILVSANFEYRDVLVNWLAGIELAGIDASRNVIVLSLDPRLSTFLDRLGLAHICIECTLMPLRNKDAWHRSIWKSRVIALATILTHNVSVTLSDLDALWLQDPRPYLKNADLVASRGSFPKWASEAWGATVCMGFVHFNAGAAAFVRNKFLSYTLTKGDDQVALNLALHASGLTWNPSSGVSSFNRLEYEHSSSVNRGHTTTPTITLDLLPHTSFVRLCHENHTLDHSIALNHVVILHCYTPKTAHDKQHSLASRGLWFLTENWQTLLDHLPSPIAGRPSDFFRTSALPNLLKGSALALLQRHELTVDFL